MDFDIASHTSPKGNRFDQGRYEFKPLNRSVNKTKLGV
jgi:hypothetical protein